MGGDVKYRKRNLILLGWVLKLQHVVYENVLFEQKRIKL